MNIKMPNSFNLEQAIKFTCRLHEIEDSDSYTCDYSRVGTVEPFGMLLISSKVREFIKERKESKHFVLGHDTNDYASHMGYFQSVYLDYGKKPGEAGGSNTYVPITKININQSYRVALFEKEMSIEQYIEKEIAKKLIRIVSTESKELKDTLTFCITEIIRNVYDHSKSKELWFAGQYWPRKDMVEIAILDEGEGISNTLKRNKKLIVDNDIDALKLSLQPGVTKSLDTKRGNDIYSNQGFGLFMTSKICESAGSFAICSGNACLTINDNGKSSKESSFNGTAIRLRLQPSKIHRINLDLIRAEGNRIADEIKRDLRISANLYEKIV